MQITISGLPGAGKNTVAEYLAKKLKLRHYSIGDFRRKMARELGMKISDLNKLGEKKAFTDKRADEYQRKIGKKEKNFVIDSRLGWYFIPNSLKIFLNVKPAIGAKRIFRHKRKTEKKYRTIKQVIEANKERVKSDIKRYKKYYRINPHKLENYDIIIDTSNLNIRQMNNLVEKVIKKMLRK